MTSFYSCTCTAQDSVAYLCSHLLLFGLITLLLHLSALLTCSSLVMTSLHVDLPSVRLTLHLTWNGDILHILIRLFSFFFKLSFKSSLHIWIAVLNQSLYTVFSKSIASLLILLKCLSRAELLIPMRSKIFHGSCLSC